MQFVDLAAQRRHLDGRIEAAVQRVVASGQYILGPDVAEFERQIAAYVGAGHAVACANGTDALLVPLMAAGIGPGDAVFVPSFTFAATAEVVALARAEPVFVDVDPGSYNIDVAQLREAVRAVREDGRLRPRAVIPVDLFGLAADYEPLMELAAEEELLVVEDAAQSIGGTSGGRKCGSFGHVAGTSFYPAKPLGCYGDGGAMFTDDAEMATLLRSIAFHGRGAHQYDNVRVGLNSRLDTIQAAILIEKLAVLEDEMEARGRVARRYAEALRDVVRVPAIDNANRSAWAQFAIETDRRDALKAHLGAEGVPTMIYYPKPLHQQEAYRHFPRAAESLSVSEGLSERILCLPMHPYLGADDQERVIASVRSFFDA